MKMNNMLKFIYSMLILFLLLFVKADLAGTDVKHDISTCESLLPTYIKNGRESKKAELKEFYELLMPKRYGTYFCSNPDIKILEDKKIISKMYIKFNSTDNVEIVMEDEKGNFFSSPQLSNGFATDGSLFFGDKKGGFCFVYQIIGQNMHVIYSPYGIQKKLIFKRLPKSSKPAITSSLASIDATNNGDASFTNFSFYAQQMTDSSSRNRALKKINRIIEARIGTYVCVEKKMFDCKYWKGAEKLYLAIVSSNEVYLIEEMNGIKYLVFESTPGTISDTKLSFGYIDTYYGLYKAEGDNISVIFYPWIPIKPGIINEKQHIDQIKNYGLFQRKIIFKRTNNIEKKDIPKKWLHPRNQRGSKGNGVP